MPPLVQKAKPKPTPGRNDESSDEDDSVQLDQAAAHAGRDDFVHEEGYSAQDHERTGAGHEAEEDELSDVGASCHEGRCDGRQDEGCEDGPSSSELVGQWWEAQGSDEAADEEERALGRTSDEEVSLKLELLGFQRDCYNISRTDAYHGADKACGIASCGEVKVLDERGLTESRCNDGSAGVVR